MDLRSNYVKYAEDCSLHFKMQYLRRSSSVNYVLNIFWLYAYAVYLFL